MSFAALTLIIAVVCCTLSIIFLVVIEQEHGYGACINSSIGGKGGKGGNFTLIGNFSADDLTRLFPHNGRSADVDSSRGGQGGSGGGEGGAGSTGCSAP